MSTKHYNPQAKFRFSNGELVQSADDQLRTPRQITSYQSLSPTLSPPIMGSLCSDVLVWPISTSGDQHERVQEEVQPVHSHDNICGATHSGWPQFVERIAFKTRVVFTQGRSEVDHAGQRSMAWTHKIGQVPINLMHSSSRIDYRYNGQFGEADCGHVLRLHFEGCPNSVPASTIDKVSCERR